MANIKITIEYDGTNYSGWQRQKNTDATIQQVIEDSLKKLNNNLPVIIYGAGRTDAGVHALGQVANFSLDTKIAPKRIPFALNSMLPADIVCKKAEEVSNKFHARYCALAKKYRYRIYNSRIPSAFLRNYAYNKRRPLDFQKMKLAAKFLQGTHDLASFKARSSGINKKNTVRTINTISLKKQEKDIYLEVIGDGFLYKMIRIITGTLIEVGLDKRDADISNLIADKDRTKAGFTAPSKGLTLLKVFY